MNLFSSVDFSFGADGFDLRDAVTAALVLLAALMCFAAGVGLIRFPDVLSRLHAATKPQILGIIAIVADVAVTNFSVGTLTLAVAIVFFQSLTAPAAAHMTGRSAFRTNHFDRGTLVLDELTPVEEARAAAPPPAAVGDTASEGDVGAGAGDHGR